MLIHLSSDTCMVPEMKIGWLLNTDRIIMVPRNNVTSGTILSVLCPIGSRLTWEDHDVMCFKGIWDKYGPFCVSMYFSSTYVKGIARILL